MRTNAFKCSTEFAIKVTLVAYISSSFNSIRAMNRVKVILTSLKAIIIVILFNSYLYNYLLKNTHIKKVIIQKEGNLTDFNDLDIRCQGRDPE